MNEHEAAAEDTSEWAWEYDDCEVCGDFATHRLYWGDELMHMYCDACGNKKAAAMARFWRQVGDVAKQEGQELDVP